MRSESVRRQSILIAGRLEAERWRAVWAAFAWSRSAGNIRLESRVGSALPDLSGRSIVIVSWKGDHYGDEICSWNRVGARTCYPCASRCVRCPGRKIECADRSGLRRLRPIRPSRTLGRLPPGRSGWRIWHGPPLSVGISPRALWAPLLAELSSPLVSFEPGLSRETRATAKVARVFMRRASDQFRSGLRAMSASDGSVAGASSSSGAICDPVAPVISRAPRWKVK
jgi:hypothetical protein